MAEVRYKGEYMMAFLDAIGPIGLAGVNAETGVESFFKHFTQNMDHQNMPSTKELRERRGALRNRFDAILNLVESEDRDLSPKEESELQQIKNDDDQLRKRVELQEEQASRNLELSKPIDRRDVGNFGSGFNTFEPSVSDLDCAIYAHVQNAMSRPVDDETWGKAEQAELRPGAAGIDIPLNRCRPTPGNEVSFSQRASNAMTTKAPSKGGVLRPAGFVKRLEAALKSFGPMIETSEVWISEDGRESPWPTLDDTDAEGFLIGEGEEASETEIAVGATIFRSHKASSGLLKVSYELLRDTPIDLSGEIGNAFGIRLGRIINRLCTVGDTADGPRGILPSAPVGKVTASETAVSADEFIDLIASVDPAYRSMPGCGWMMHPDVFAAVSKLKDEHGQYLTGTLEAGVKSLLRGYPVFFNPNMPYTMTAGTKVALFGDLRAYKLRIVGGIRLRQMTEKFADSDQVGFVAFVEFDSALLDAGTHPVKCLQMKP